MAKRKTSARKTTPNRKNPIPLPFSPDNLRRWAFLNFPILVDIKYKINLKEFPFAFLEAYIKGNEYFKLRENIENFPWDLSFTEGQKLFYDENYTFFDLNVAYKNSRLRSRHLSHSVLIRLVQQRPNDDFYYFLSLMKFFVHIYTLIWSLSIPIQKKIYFWKIYMGNWENLEKLRLFMLFRNIGDFKLASPRLENIITGRKALINQWKSLSLEEQNKQISKFLEENA